MLFDRRGAVSLCAMLALAVSLLTGCGGKSNTTGTSAASSGASTAASSTSSSSSPGATDAAFIARADPICRKANVLLARSSAKGKKPAELAVAIVANETIERKAAAELARLTPPHALAPAWAKLLGDRRELANGLGNLAAVVKREDQTALPALGKSKKKLHADLAKVAGAAGFKDCSKIG